MGESSTTRTWDDSKWQRYGLFAGVVFVVLSLVAVFAPGSPPARDASADEIAKYFVDNDSGIRLAAILAAFALIFGVWWLGSLWRVISKLESSGPRLAFVAAAGFIIAGGFGTIGQALFTVPATRDGELLGASEFAWSLGFITFGFALALTAAHMLALAALTIRSGFLPKWMGWLALASGLVCAVGTIGAGSEEAAIGIIGFIGYLTWLLWVLLASVLLYRRKAV
ncbi:MAG: DUF4386 family protein [Actinobacteria bacterium]|nr:DUF4386 family protein [Actinomycetota bacterium]